MKASLVALLLCPLSVAAEPLADLKPLAFLAGSCWKGELAGAAVTDEHCFAWIYDGKALRDTHTVRAIAMSDYVGETTYYWDSGSKRIEFLYIENRGGVSRGRVEGSPGGLNFPSTQYVEGGKEITYRARWTVKGSDEYEAWSESQTKNGWSTMFKVTLRRKP